MMTLDTSLSFTTSSSNEKLNKDTTTNKRKLQGLRGGKNNDDLVANIRPSNVRQFGGDGDISVNGMITLEVRSGDNIQLFLNLQKTGPENGDKDQHQIRIHEGENCGDIGKEIRDFDFTDTLFGFDKNGNASKDLHLDFEDNDKDNKDEDYERKKDCKDSSEDNDKDKNDKDDKDKDKDCDKSYKNSDRNNSRKHDYDVDDFECNLAVVYGPSDNKKKDDDREILGCGLLIQSGGSENACKRRRYM